MTDYIKKLTDLRAWMKTQNLAGYFVPRADEVQGEYVMPCDARLEWLNGFAGSAGMALVTLEHAALVVDGRYTTEAAKLLKDLPWEVCHFIDKPWGEWLKGKVDKGELGYDPRLFTPAWLAVAEKRAQKLGLTLRAVAENPIDKLWQGRPAATATPVEIFPQNLAGKSSNDKRIELGKKIAEQNAAAALVTDPTSVAWLLNIRANDLEATPVAMSKVLLRADGSAVWYIDGNRVAQDVRTHIGSNVTIADPGALKNDAATLKDKTVLADEDTLNLALLHLLEGAGCKVVAGPCVTELPKACKNPTEVAGMAAAHKRDGVALARFMQWLDGYVKPKPGNYRESDLVTQLAQYRARANEYRGHSFETICGTGEHGAVIHYRVSPETDRPIENNTLLLIDSGGQYVDGTTDVTRVFSFGNVSGEMKRAYTAVLRGHIALGSAKFPKGTTGASLDGLARAALWNLGLDFDHGTGHGVGHFLSVHEGPQNISSRSTVPLQPGMVVSNEPGFYKPGEYGIRIENLITVKEATTEGSTKPFYEFETLTLAPYDRNLIVVDDLTAPERAWVDGYHARVLREIGPQVEPEVRSWLEKACAPL